MKTLSYIFIFLSIYQCFSLNLKSSQLVSPSKDNLVESFSSAYGNNTYVPPVGVPLKSPEISNHISDEVLPPAPGKIEAAEEIPSETDYYDGEIKLNKMNVNCKIYASQNDCFHQSFCGWCGSTSSCIGGDAKGPYEPCLKATYLFSQNVYQMKTASTNYGGLQTNVVIQP